MLEISGKTIRYGDHVNTDVIIPARYLVTTSETELGHHCMEDLDEQFPEKVKQAPIVVAGRNFGCGSSREHAPLALKGAGVQCIVAASFARIFFRNCINLGLPICECPALVHDLKEGDRVQVDVESGVVKNVTQAQRYRIAPYPAFLQRLVSCGGLNGYMKEAADHDGST